MLWVYILLYVYKLSASWKNEKKMDTCTIIWLKYVLSQQEKRIPEDRISVKWSWNSKFYE